MTRHTVRSRIVTLVKIAVAIGLLGYLVVRAQQHERFSQLVTGDKSYPLLLLAVVLVFVATAISFLRWHLLVRSLGLPFSVRDAFRLSAVGYLMNFVALGSVGGDLFKAFLIAKQYPGQRTEAVATVVIDRVVGLYALLIVASSSMMLWSMEQDATTRFIRDATFLFTLIAAIAFCLLLVPGFTGGRVTVALSRLPGVGHTLVRLVQAVRVYRNKLPVVFLALLESVAVHVLLVLAIYLIGAGLPGKTPNVAEHFLIVPLSMVAGALPITPNGLGTFEAALDYLYRAISLAEIEPGRGTIVALFYRLSTIVVASLGAVYYFADRRLIDKTIREIEQDDPRADGAAMAQLAEDGGS